MSSAAAKHKRMPDSGENGLTRPIVDGTTDSVAWGGIGNRVAVHVSSGSFALEVLDGEVEYGGFPVDLDDEPPASCLEARSAS